MNNKYLGKVSTVLLCIAICSCASISIGRGKHKVIIQPEKPACDVKKAGSDCTVTKIVKAGVVTKTSAPFA